MRLDQRERREDAGDRLAAASERDAAEDERHQRERHDLAGIEQTKPAGKTSAAAATSSGIPSALRPAIEAMTASTIANASSFRASREIQPAQRTKAENRTAEAARERCGARLR